MILQTHCKLYIAFSRLLFSHPFVVSFISHEAKETLGAMRMSGINPHLQTSRLRLSFSLTLILSHSSFLFVSLSFFLLSFFSLFFIFLSYFPSLFSFSLSFSHFSSFCLTILIFLPQSSFSFFSHHISFFFWSHAPVFISLCLFFVSLFSFSFFCPVILFFILTVLLTLPSQFLSSSSSSFLDFRFFSRIDISDMTDLFLICVCFIFLL